MEHYTRSVQITPVLSAERKNPLRFVTDASCYPNTDIEDSVCRELIEYINQKSLDAGFKTVSDLARAFGTKNPDKVLRNLREFGKTAELNAQYMKQLQGILQIEPSRIDEIRSRHQAALFADKELFLKHFELLLGNSGMILENLQYRNIRFFGLSIESAWVGRSRPLTLGELFFRYNRKEWIAPKCCGSVYIYRASGSALSGCHTYHGYCPGCKTEFKGSHPTFSEILHPFLTSLPDFDYIPTAVTIRELIPKLH